MIQKLFFILLSILVIPDIYIYKMFIDRNTVCTGIKLLYFIPSVLLLIGLIWILFFASPETMQKPYAGWYIVAFFLFSLPKLLFCICSLLDLPLNYFFKCHAMPFSWLGILLGVVCAGIILYGAIIGKTKFDIKEITFHSSDLPSSFDNYKIIQLSDIHIGSWQGNKKSIQQAIRLINDQKPDLIVFTGDLVNHRADELDGFEEILAQMHAKDGTYSILGNHDYGPYYHWNTPQEKAENLKELERREASMGWRLLNNEHTYLTKGNDSIALIGVENWGMPPFDGRGDLKKAMQGVNTPFKILLSHNPTHWRAEVLPDSNINLTLSGHTHAMQLACGQHSPSSWVYKEWKGMYDEDNQHLYVNVGLGFVGMPFRFGAWPEITVITLKKE